jgi:CHASE2 domain-containing sensor protein
MSHIFISYSRKDKAFAQKLHAALQEQNRKTWIDWQDILPTEKWWNAIESGIEAADTFVFIISPDSVNSKVCIREINHAVKQHKRLVPIVCRDVDDRTVYPELSAHNWLFMRESDNFDAAFAQLMHVIDVDLEYVRAHTRLQMRAIEWEREKKDNSFLLRGNDLIASERLLKQGADKKPELTSLQIEYVVASRTLPYRRVKRRVVLLSSLVVTSLVVISRFMGALQSLELLAYDQLMRSRFNEPRDDRFLIIEVTKSDIEMLRSRYNGSKGTIPDQALYLLLQTLQQAEPRLIGLDFYRDFPAEPDLARQLQQSQNLIAVCKFTSDQTAQNKDGVRPPAEVPLSRVGFADFLNDEQNMVRRQLLLHGADSTCPTDESFNLVLARRYLEAEGYQYTPPPGDSEDYGKGLMLGNTTFNKILGFTGGYQVVDYDGYQILLNYRIHDGDANQFAQRVTLQQLLDGNLSQAQIKNRIVMIGVAAKLSGEADYWNTPHGALTGVMIQAQMTSQLISAALDERPLIWWWSLWIEMLWILGWSVVGGLIFWSFYRLLPLVIAAIASLATLYLVCYLVFVFASGWIPFIPAAIAFILTGGSVGYFTYRLRQL